MMTNLALSENKNWFETLYEQHSKALWYYLLKTLGDAALADDVFQETFYRMWRVKPKGLHPAQEKAYLYKIGTNLVIDTKRKEKRTGKIFSRSSLEDDIKETIMDSPFDGDVKPYFEMLSIREKTLLWLAYIEEYNHKDIAKIMGIKENTVKVVLFRAKKRLAGLLGGEKNENN